MSVGTKLTTTSHVGRKEDPMPESEATRELSFLKGDINTAQIQWGAYINGLSEAYTIA